MASNMQEDSVPNIEDQAFDTELPPTYDAAFPALSADARPVLANVGSWQPKFQSRQSKSTQVHSFYFLARILFYPFFCEVSPCT